MNYNIIFYIFILNVSLIKSDCVLKYTNGLFPLFLENDLSVEIVTPSTSNVTTGDTIAMGYSNSKSFSEGSVFRAYCPSGFKLLSFHFEGNYHGGEFVDRVDTETKEIQLKCLNEHLKVQLPFRKTEGLNDTSEYEFLLNNFTLWDNQLECNSFKSEIYELQLENQTVCEHTSYFIGYNIENYPILIADSCFDMNIQRLQYFHFLVTNASLMTRQPLNQPIRYLDSKYKRTLLNDVFTFVDRMVLSRAQENVLRDFYYVDFFPEYLTAPYILQPLSNIANSFHKFLGWKNFVNGNWKTFNELLKLRSENDSYDVYMGTSNNVEAPITNESFTNFTAELSYYKQTIPKYVWTLLRSRTSSEEFVIIGINSPYFQLSNTAICSDICDEIEWLNPMKEIRKYSLYGYMFCCQPKDVIGILEGFPRECTSDGIKL